MLTLIVFMHTASGNLLAKLDDIASRNKVDSWSIEDKLIVDIAQVRSNDSIVVVTHQDISGLQAGDSSNDFDRSVVNISSPICNLILLQLKPWKIS